MFHSKSNEAVEQQRPRLHREDIEVGSRARRLLNPRRQQEANGIETIKKNTT
jgi:hypothetical protein